jgi:hypothetical protein
MGSFADGGSGKTRASSRSSWRRGDKALANKQKQRKLASSIGMLGSGSAAARTRRTMIRSKLYSKRYKAIKEQKAWSCRSRRV